MILYYKYGASAFGQSEKNLIERRDSKKKKKKRRGEQERQTVSSRSLKLRVGSYSCLTFMLLIPAYL